MNGWERDKQWADRFTPEMKCIIGSIISVDASLIHESSLEDDQERATDLIVLTSNLFRIGCRMRHHDVLSNPNNGYAGQFTIREGRPSGVKTELAKILEGWGDLFFYGIADKPELNIQQWGIGNLNVFREWYQWQSENRPWKKPGYHRDNKEKGGSWFRAFNWCELPSSFIVSKRGISCIPARTQ